MVSAERFIQKTEDLPHELRNVVPILSSRLKLLDHMPTSSISS